MDNSAHLLYIILYVAVHVAGFPCTGDLDCLLPFLDINLQCGGDGCECSDGFYHGVDGQCLDSE